MRFSSLLGYPSLTEWPHAGRDRWPRDHADTRTLLLQRVAGAALVFPFSSFTEPRPSSINGIFVNWESARPVSEMPTCRDLAGTIRTEGVIESRFYCYQLHVYPMLDVMYHGTVTILLNVS